MSDYVHADPFSGTPYFEVDLDGRTLTHPSARTAPGGNGDPGGSWFEAAVAGDRDTLFAFSGPGKINDVIVSTDNPYHRLAPMGTPEWWLRKHGYTDDPAQDEQIEIGEWKIPLWQYFVAGADPGLPSSFLHALAFEPVPGGRLPSLHHRKTQDRIIVPDHQP